MDRTAPARRATASARGMWSTPNAASGTHATRFAKAWSSRGGAELAWPSRPNCHEPSTASVSTRTFAWSNLAKSERDAILFFEPREEGSRSAGERQRREPRRSRKREARPAYVGVVRRLEHRLAARADATMDRPEEDDEITGDGGITDEELGRFLATRVCGACKGKRLRPEALAVLLGGRDIAQVGSMPLRQVKAYVESLERGASHESLGARERTIAEPLLKAVAARLGFLIDVGLDYLTLDRSAQTLSSGEGQRIRLATQIGAALVGVLYVLDEPSIGLHARDNARLIEAQGRLRDLGNTVIVVEHDRDAILSADHVIDMGPGAGVHGGEVVSQGTPDEIMRDERSITGPWLSGAKQLPIPRKRKVPGAARIRVIEARAHNLRNVTVDVPLGVFTCVTGVSGSGKSSLVVDTLLPAARMKLYNATAPVGECREVEGLDQIDKVVSIDQAPIGRTPRSNPATYTGISAQLRELYASLPEARARGYKAGRFSFNVKGGRCEACQGDGVLRIEMHFLPDVFVTCEACGGRRYNRETLEIKYRGLSIADVLGVNVEQATDLLGAVPKLSDKLEALRKVGLGYLTLGQPATTLSGGEAQRVKLARELARRATGRTLYVLDEPTSGLHFTDIEVLMTALLDLRDQGNTILVIEHNLDMVACADWVLDLGPEGGDGGGELVAEGTPEDVARSERSHTARYLRSVLDRANLQPAAVPRRSRL